MGEWASGQPIRMTWVGSANLCDLLDIVKVHLRDAAAPTLTLYQCWEAASTERHDALLDYLEREAARSGRILHVCCPNQAESFRMELGQRGFLPALEVDTVRVFGRIVRQSIRQSPG